MTSSWFSLARFRICGSFYVVLEGSYGEVLLRTSELSGQLACRSTILSIRLNSLLDEGYLRSGDENGGYVFVLQAVDGIPLAVSPVYATAEERERAIDAVRRGAPWAFVTHVALGDHDFEDVVPGVVVVGAVNAGATKLEEDDDRGGPKDRGG